jgi:hypothetical protein
MMTVMASEHWMDDAEEHDYPAAQSYLSLLMDTAEAAKLVVALRAVAQLDHYKAKDVLRASGLPALPPDNVHVAKDLKKVANGKKLSPVLLVRGEPLLIADGYHRVCASYHLNENEDIPSRIVNRNMSE